MRGHGNDRARGNLLSLPVGVIVKCVGPRPLKDNGMPTYGPSSGFHPKASASLRSRYSVWLSRTTLCLEGDWEVELVVKYRA